MKKIVFSLLAILLSAGFAKADEGMWLPFLLNRNYEDMKKNGLKLTQEQIYDVNNSSLKDAIVSLGGFCTGEIISKQSLMLTNHHCGYDAIRSNSTPEKDYLKNGFWAYDKKDELPVPGLFVSYIVRIDDVTTDILKGVTDAMSEDERAEVIAKNITERTQKADKANKDKGYRIFVRDFFEGNEYYMFTTEVYNDVRLVGAPPASVGKFGGDTDNWMWPRHTGDFAMFRVYSSKDGKPAYFSEDNIPLTAKHALPISIKGVQPNDFAMVFGFPGSTDRYLTSYGVDKKMKIELPKRVDIRAKKLAIMKKYMNADRAVALKYASKYAQVANYWKNFMGMAEQLRKNKVYNKKKDLENKFDAWQKSSDSKKYANVTSDFAQANNTLEKVIYNDAFRSEAVLSVDVNLMAYFHDFYVEESEKAEPNPMRLSGIKGFVQKRANDYFEKFDYNIERDIVAAMLEMYYQDMPKEQQADFVKKLGDKKKIKKFVDKAFKKSIFTSKARYEKFAESFDLKKLKKDPIYVLVKNLLAKYNEVNGAEEIQKAKKQLKRANRLFVDGLRKMQPEKAFYPNANSTLRLTYGTVGDYKARDAVHYDYFTTIEGIMQKELPDKTDPNNEFIVEDKLKKLYENKDYGRYGKDGDLVVNFITNNDITGGNSGSPVINGNGELIGCAFDGNWEAMSGDIFFEDKIQRTICVDARYILFIVDKYAGAKNLIDEMIIVE